MADLIPLGPDFNTSPETLRVETLYVDDERSVALIALNGVNRTTINHLSETTYQVIAGTGLMHLPDATIELQAGVSVTIPAETPYHDEGSVVMLATSTPPFNLEFVETK